MKKLIIILTLALFSLVGCTTGQTIVYDDVYYSQPEPEVVIYTSNYDFSYALRIRMFHQPFYFYYYNPYYSYYYFDYWYYYSPWLWNYPIYSYWTWRPFYYYRPYVYYTVNNNYYNYNSSYGHRNSQGGIINKTIPASNYIRTVRDVPSTVNREGYRTPTRAPYSDPKPQQEYRRPNSNTTIVRPTTSNRQPSPKVTPSIRQATPSERVRVVPSRPIQRATPNNTRVSPSRQSTPSRQSSPPPTSNTRRR